MPFSAKGHCANFFIHSLNWLVGKEKGKSSKTLASIMEVSEQKRLSLGFKKFDYKALSHNNLAILQMKKFVQHM